jgi:hypothetical protein
MAVGWREQGKFMSMAQLQNDLTENHLNVLICVDRSSAGIDAISNKIDGLECVQRGWLSHREHRREEGGLTDVWDLTPEGREILARLIESRRSSFAT